MGIAYIQPFLELKTLPDSVQLNKVVPTVVVQTVVVPYHDGGHSI
jgi:hypothetical protein